MKMVYQLNSNDNNVLVKLFYIIIKCVQNDPKRSKIISSVTHCFVNRRRWWHLMLVLLGGEFCGPMSAEIEKLKD